MRRFRMIVLTAVLVAAAGLLFAPGAAAGNFDEGAMGCAGENPAVCPPGKVGQSYSLTIYLTRDSPNDPPRGGDFDCATFSASSGDFPPGLSISDEGIISGTPTRAGSFDFYLTVRYNKTPNCAKTPSDDRFVINIAPETVRLFVSTGSLPDANIGQAYPAQTLTTGGGTASSWQLAGGTLPPGVQLASNGVLSGTPTASGLFSFTVQANGPNNSDTKQLSIFVLAPLELQTLTGKKPPATGLTAKKVVNAPLTTGVKAVGGRGPYTFSTSGSLAPGLALDPATGAISGAGTTAGRYAASITVTDGTGAKASVPFTVTILPLLQFVKGKVLPVGRVDRFYSARIPVAGKEARTALFAIAGRIPPGLELDDTGRLSGTLLVAGAYRLRVYAFPATGAPITRFFTIRVRP